MFSSVTLVGKISSNIEMNHIDGKTQCQLLVNVNINRKESEMFKVVAQEWTANFIQKFFWPGKMIGIDGTLSKGKYYGLSNPEEVVVLANSVFFTDAPKKDDENRGN